MKRLISSLLLIAMLIACFAGCANDATPSEPETPTEAVAAADENLADAAAYVKTIYKNVTEATPADYERVSAVPVGAVKYDIEWTVDVSEEFVKIVKGDDGKVIIDVNEACEEDVPYVLTATLTGTDGTKQSLSWNHMIPAALGEDFGAIVDLAYTLEDGQSLPNTATLTGVIVSVDTPYSADYKNVTVTIQVAGREDKPIQCYRLKGEGADTITIGDTITVTGTLKNYKGTIEFDAGCTLDKVVKGEGGFEIPTDPAEIMELAYQLKPGESLPYNVTLTGKIHSINSGYSKQYGNISVAMKVEGSDRSIEVFRLKGEGVENLSINDVITVTGSITNYKGTIEFNAGCTLDSYIDFDAPQQPKDPRKVLETVAALWEGGTLNYTATLTGTIIEIESPWSDYYGNITVIMVVDGCDDIPVTCFRIKGEGAEDLKVGDTITVRGSMMNYYGKVEFKAGSVVIDIVKGEGEAEEVKPVEIPEGATAAEIIELAYALEEGNSLASACTLTGVITKVNTPYSDQYKNVTVTIVVNGDTAHPIECYRLKGTGADVIAVGDTVTVKGTLKNYYGKIEFDSGCELVSYTKGEGEAEEVKPVVIPEGATAAEIIELAYALEEGNSLASACTLTGVITKVNTAYSDQYKNVTVTIVVNGDTAHPIECYRMKGTGADVIAVGDTVTVNGILKNYYGKIEFDSGCKLVSYTKAEVEETEPENTEPEVTEPEVTEPEVTEPEATEPEATEPEATEPEVTEPEITEPEVTEPEVTEPEVTEPEETQPEATEPEATEPEVPAAGSALSIAEAYALGASMDHNTYTEGKYHVTGVIKSIANTTYGNMTITDGTNTLYIYGTWDKEGNRFDAMETQPAVGDTITVYGVIGNYNGAQMKNGTITSHISAEPEETEPEVEIPAAGSTLPIAEAAALGASMDHNTYTEGKYYVTGVIKSIANTTYGNMTITDGTNTLYIYGTWDKEGNRFDAMETQPAVGDTITVYGVIGNYNGAQMKNGTITSHISAEPEETEPEVEIPAAGSTLSIAEAYALGASMEHNTTTEGKYYVTGTIQSIANTTYGNMTITDGTNTLYIYGTWDKEGNRFDAMETQPAVDDIITLYGVIGNYNGAQMKNGVIQ